MNVQKSSNKIWLDESGTAIPFNRITKAERLKERHTARLAKDFKRYNEQGRKLKDLAVKLCEEAYIADMQDKGVDPKKSMVNYTFYNFDQTIKVERAVHGNPSYDMATVEAAKQLFDDYLAETVTSKEDFAQEMINDAFESRAGKLDKSKINRLISYKSRSKYKSFIKACDLLSTAVRYPSKSVYYRVWLKGDDGKYDNIDVQFSSL